MNMRRRGDERGVRGKIKSGKGREGRENKRK